MGLLDSIVGRREERSPNESLVDSLSDLDPQLGNAFSSYLLNRSRLSVLSREASEQFQYSKSSTRTEQGRAMDPFFREMHKLVGDQAKLITTMEGIAKKRKFRMARALGEGRQSVNKTLDTLARIAAASNDPSINRLQGLQDAMHMYRSVEQSVLWPALQ